jgi:hypothetical protein
MLGQLIGHDLPLVEKRRIVRSFFLLLAEREEFEPAVSFDSAAAARV